MNRRCGFSIALAVLLAAGQASLAADAPAVTDPGPAKPAAPATTPRLNRPVAEGSLGATDMTKLKSLANALIAEGQFRTQTTLTPGDFKSFRQTIMGVSLALFSEDILPNGTTVQFMQYGVNVELKRVIDERFEKATLTPPEARILTRDFSRMLQLRVSLAEEGLDDAQRAALQTELNNLINKHFTVPVKKPAIP